MLRHALLLKLCPRLHHAFFVSLLAMSSYHVNPSIDRFDTAVLGFVTPSLLLCRPCHYTMSKHLQFCPRRRHTLFVALSVLLSYHVKPSPALSETSHTLPRLLCYSVSLRSHHVYHVFFAILSACDHTMSTTSSLLFCQSAITPCQNFDSAARGFAA